MNSLGKDRFAIEEFKEDLKNALLEQILDLKPVSVSEIPADSRLYDYVTFDGREKDNGKWLALVTDRLKTAETFEIHCWNEETEWIELALRYGALKDTDWKYGKIITGAVTDTFADMLLNLPKPADTEIYNKMTPFFNVFLDDTFQSCHYGTENYV